MEQRQTIMSTQTNWQSIDGTAFDKAPRKLFIGDFVKIDLQTGEIWIRPDVPLDAAAREFWAIVSKYVVGERGLCTSPNLSVKNAVQSE